ncbi:Protein of unknown function [Shimia gijangensis]|uniref:DUF992 domain-containing protein n=1 Tax=Shimia gijangensis TaxID=1470563 RepID=A0A1M6K660_9RHOB|nr:DUF992 domain-containing protein [Shimia gijangensis]SHJ54428.1 Protein of unknown function [Shimia gijangensis]
MKHQTKLGKFVIASVAAVSMFASAQVAQAADDDVQKGVLKCTVAGGAGLILGSKKKLDCVFEKSNGAEENYSGRILKVGLDIGVTKESHITWAVFAPSELNAVGALTGNYAGLSAEATVVGGVGANVLVGGGQDSVTLQPLSVQTQTGLNIAGGIGSIKLEFEE